MGKFDDKGSEEWEVLKPRKVLIILINYASPYDKQLRLRVLAGALQAI